MANQRGKKDSEESVRLQQRISRVPGVLNSGTKARLGTIGQVDLRIRL